MQFFNYTQKFSHLRFSENLSSEDLEEVFKNKRTRLQSIRSELKTIKELNEFELVQLWNLSPDTKEEAISWISSLERLVGGSGELAINRAIEIIKKHRNSDY